MKRLAMALALACAGSIGMSANEQASKPKTSPEAAAARIAQIGKLSFSGSPTMIGCAGGQHYTQHSLGFVPRGTRIRVDVISGEAIDPIASIVIAQMGANAPNGMRASYAYDDDSGGGRDPRVEITAEFDGNVTVNMGSYDGTFGCYALKVEMTLPG